MCNRIYVGLVSDSHGCFKALERMAEQAPDTAAWIHCGDYYTDGEDLAAAIDVPVYGVMGNNDYYGMSDGPECRVVVMDSVRILAVHGHQWYGEKRLERLVELGKQHHADVVVFGHTHRRFFKKVDDMTIVNPGSISLPRDGRRGSYGIVCIENGMLANIELYELQ